MPSLRFQTIVAKIFHVLVSRLVGVGGTIPKQLCDRSPCFIVWSPNACPSVLKAAEGLCHAASSSYKDTVGFLLRPAAF